MNCKLAGATTSSSVARCEPLVQQSCRADGDSSDMRSFLLHQRRDPDPSPILAVTEGNAWTATTRTRSWHAQRPVKLDATALQSCCTSVLTYNERDKRTSRGHTKSLLTVRATRFAVPNSETKHRVRAGAVACCGRREVLRGSLCVLLLAATALVRLCMLAQVGGFCEGHATPWVSAFERLLAAVDTCVSSGDNRAPSFLSVRRCDAKVSQSRRDEMLHTPTHACGSSRQIGSQTICRSQALDK